MIPNCLRIIIFAMLQTLSSLLTVLEQILTSPSFKASHCLKKEKKLYSSRLPGLLNRNVNRNP